MSDDLLKPEEIEALLNAAGGGIRAPEPGPTAARSTAHQGGDFAEALKQQTLKAGATGEPKGSGRSGRAAAPKTAAERLLEQAQAGLAAAVSADRIPADLGDAAPFEFHSFEQSAAASGEGVGLNALQDVELDLRIELGRTELLIEEVLQLKEGSVVPLNKLAGDPVDILVNGRLIARGEVLVLNDNFCVRVAEILAPTV